MVRNSFGFRCSMVNGCLMFRFTSLFCYKQREYIERSVNESRETKGMKDGEKIVQTIKGPSHLN